MENRNKNHLNTTTQLNIISVNSLVSRLLALFPCLYGCSHTVTHVTSLFAFYNGVIKNVVHTGVF